MTTTQPTPPPMPSVPPASCAPPLPSDTDAAAFVAALRRLKAWSGLSYRQLERRAERAGHVLPYSTAASLLGRDRLPRKELVVAFVEACGVGEPETRAWVAARNAIACGPLPQATQPRPARPRQSQQPQRHVRPQSTHGQQRPRRTSRSRRTRAATAVLLVALLTGAATQGAFTQNEEVHETRTSSAVPG
ncbi:helix-turn-helix domain-containing protein [Streptomyces silaceus]|uniref:helix-turn-helix domain-containing protein n=1 Tax=Streptomyces silaceus TaxID=545123 RepID=UPI000A8E721F|nr:helix-turn-helix transcriptional regulator [Streptomyces silaceus]